MLLALAYRHARPPLAQAVEAAQRTGALERLELAPLAPAEAEELIGTAVSGAARSLLLRESGGNPFYPSSSCARPRARRRTAPPPTS